MKDELDELIFQKLGQIVRLLSVDLTRGLPRSEQISLLHRVGLETKEIADALAIKPNTVSVAIYKSKRRPGKKVGTGDDKSSN